MSIKPKRLSHSLFLPILPSPSKKKLLKTLLRDKIDLRLTLNIMTLRKKMMIMFVLAILFNHYCKFETDKLFTIYLHPSSLKNSVWPVVIYERFIIWDKVVGFGSPRSSKHEPGLTIFFVFFDEKMYLFHKRT